jgi:hypothetical protein
MQHNANLLKQFDFNPNSLRLKFELACSERVKENTASFTAHQTLSTLAKAQLTTFQSNMKQYMIETIDLEVTRIKTAIQDLTCEAIGSLAVTIGLTIDDFNEYYSPELVFATIDANNTTLQYSEFSTLQEFYERIKVIGNYPNDAHIAGGELTCELEEVTSGIPLLKSITEAIFVLSWEILLQHYAQKTRTQRLQAYVDKRLHTRATEDVADMVKDITTDSPTLEKIIEDKVEKKTKTLTRQIIALKSQLSSKKKSSASDPKQRQSNLRTPRFGQGRGRGRGQGTDGANEN